MMHYSPLRLKLLWRLSRVNRRWLYSIRFLAKLQARNDTFVVKYVLDRAIGFLGRPYGLNSVERSGQAL
jgi:hypothetical protein